MSVDVSIPVSDADLEDRITSIIDEAGLCRPVNAFFNAARALDSVPPPAALRIGRQWHAMTKAFMFTTVASLGLMARRFGAEHAPDHDVLGAFQTAFQVIGDDLANAAPEFSAVAPEGVKGIHYIWWEDTIIAPLAALLHDTAAESPDELPAGVRSLLANMHRLADSPLGAAVQLRVVEAIALDIAVAFRRLYSKVQVGDIKPYAADGALDWVDSHIKAETVHAKCVSDEATGMTVIASTPQERTELLAFAEEYAASWAGALNEFATELTAGRVLVSARPQAFQQTGRVRS